MDDQNVKFLYGDRELQLSVLDLLTVKDDVIVSAADSALSHSCGLAARINAAAGHEVSKQSAQLISEYGEMESGMAVYTTAGKLPYKAIIHAVGPEHGDGNAQRTLEQTISRSLQLCDTNSWQSVAFPAYSAESFGVSIVVCAQAFFRAITRFWDARHECNVEKITLCLTEQTFQPFFVAFREDAISEAHPTQLSRPDHKKEIGYVEIGEESINLDTNDEVDGWFKKN
jgi:O-acetyl-ADP-ribose deacetylase (regulator of RNase III)